MIITSEKNEEAKRELMENQGGIEGGSREDQGNQGKIKGELREKWRRIKGE
jgi:hypothetical protein